MATTPNTFEGARLDRVTARRRDADWVAERLADPDSRAVVVGDAAVLVEDDRLALIALPADGAEPLLLGVQDGRRCSRSTPIRSTAMRSRPRSWSPCATSRRASPRTTAG